MFRMNSKLNSNLFWAAVYGNSEILLKTVSELVASFIILFVVGSAVYNKESIGSVYAGMLRIYEHFVLAKYPSFHIIYS